MALIYLLIFNLVFIATGNQNVLETWLDAFFNDKVSLPAGSKESCGKSSANDTGIISGDRAKLGAWPWIVSLIRKNEHFCAGTMINTRWVLTSSRCMRQIDPTQLFVRFGAQNINIANEQEQIIEVEQIFVHPNSTGSLDYDLALILLKSSVNITDNVSNVCLPLEAEEPHSENNACYFLGWDHSERVLRQTKHVRVEAEKCLNMKSMVCTGAEQRYLSRGCHGDNGGPLVCQQDGGRWTQIGVASFIVGDCNQFTAFTDISNHMSWVKSRIEHTAVGSSCKGCSNSADRSQGPILMCMTLTAISGLMPLLAL